MKVERFLERLGGEFYVGVPDSQLRPLCDYLTANCSEREHIVAPNEGVSVGLAAGYHLATGKVPIVYMQNSGQGNSLNPVASLTHEEVYKIPIIYIIGWRGQPGTQDEPQHVHQGAITLDLLEMMGVEYAIIEKDTSEDEILRSIDYFSVLLKLGRSVAYVIGKDGLSAEQKIKHQNRYTLKRESVIDSLIEVSQEDVIISTTGKTSRELFELREKKGQNHKCDFLTVGSMGHSLAIAHSIALQKPSEKVWCLDGDGAALMHMGTMALVGSSGINNLVHVLLNNEAHESVGGISTLAKNLVFTDIAKACGYERVISIERIEDLPAVLNTVKQNNVLTFIEIKVAIGSRGDLGRPTIKPIENKVDFMKRLYRN